MEEFYLQCRVCRRKILSDTHILKSLSTGNQFCNSGTLWYIKEGEMPEWIAETIDKESWQRGKLYCPNCGCRLGSFNFIKIFKCTECYGHTIPPIHILRDRVDKKVSNPEKFGNFPRSSNSQDENICDIMLHQQQKLSKASGEGDKRTVGSIGQINQLQLENSCPIIGEMQCTMDEQTCRSKLLPEGFVETEHFRPSSKDELNNSNSLCSSTEETVRMSANSHQICSNPLFPSECIDASISEHLHGVPSSLISTDMASPLDSCNNLKKFENGSEIPRPSEQNIDTNKNTADTLDKDVDKHIVGVCDVSKMQLNILGTCIPVDSSVKFSCITNRNYDICNDVSTSNLGGLEVNNYQEGLKSVEVPDDRIDENSCLNEQCESVNELCCNPEFNHTHSCDEGHAILHLSSPQKDAKSTTLDNNSLVSVMASNHIIDFDSADNSIPVHVVSGIKAVQCSVITSHNRLETVDHNYPSIENSITSHNQLETRNLNNSSMDTQIFDDDVHNDESDTHSLNNTANPGNEPVISNTFEFFFDEDIADNRTYVEQMRDVDVSLTFDFLEDGDRGGWLRQRRRKRKEKNGQRKMKKDLSEEKEDIKYEPWLVDFPEEHQCPVCFDLFCEPHACYPCDHVLCEACLRRLGQNNIYATRCPMCRQLIVECIRKDDFRNTLKEIYPDEYRARLREQKRYLNNRFSPLPQSKTAVSNSPEDIRNIILANRYNRNLPNPRVKLILTGFLILVCFVPAVSLGKAVVDSAVSLMQDLMTWL